MATSSAAYTIPAQPASTVPVTVPAIVAEFERLDKDMQSLEADFKQYVRWDESGMAQTVEGSVEFAKPEKLRVTHTLPEEQVVVSDGDILWVYRASTGQVVKSRLADWKKSEPMAQGLLEFGKYSGMLKAYDVSITSQTAADEKGYRMVELTLKPREAKAGQEFSLTLSFSTRDYFPYDTRLRAGTVSVHSIFSNIRYNPPIPPQRFEFKPPPGADVFDNTQKGQ